MAFWQENGPVLVGKKITWQNGCDVHLCRRVHQFWLVDMSNCRKPIRFELFSWWCDNDYCPLKPFRDHPPQVNTLTESSVIFDLHKLRYYLELALIFVIYSCRQLDMRWNKLESIHQDAFCGVKTLYRLYADGNQFQSECMSICWFNKHQWKINPWWINRIFSIDGSSEQVDNI